VAQRFRQWVNDYGLGFSVPRPSKVVVPAYLGTLQLSSAHPADPASPAPGGSGCPPERQEVDDARLFSRWPALRWPPSSGRRCRVDQSRYLAMAVVAAIDSSFGGLRAHLGRRFRPAVVLAFVSNAAVAVLLVWIGDQLGGLGHGRGRRVRRADLPERGGRRRHVFGG